MRRLQQSPLRLHLRALVAVIVMALALHVAPLAAQIAVVGNTVEEHTAAPGQRYEGSIVIHNQTAQPQPVRVYQTDYTFFADGTSHFDSAGSVRRSNARWITPAASGLVVPPSGDVTLTYVVTVPAGDTIQGTYWSAVMIEGAASAPPVAHNREVALGAVVRYAVQLATHVRESGSRKVALSRQTLTSDSTGARALTLDVQNVGERGYRPRLWVELYDADANLRAKVEQQRGLLYPGSSLRQRFQFEKLPPGSYKAVVFADTGDDAVFASQYKLTF